MTPPVAVLALPYVLSILIKVSSLVLNRRLVMRSLEDLAAIPRPPSAREGFDLDANQREVIARHVSHATLISASILTLLSSFVATVVLAFRYSASPWLAWLLPIVLASAVAVMWWILPARVYALRRKWLGIKRSIWLVSIFCVYDALLGAITVAFALRSEKSP
jgi:hypothetical protein